MAYENPYANTMNYKPRTLWTQPERPRTDWSTFWGKAEEDDDGTENGDENGYDPEGIESTAGGVAWKESLPYKYWSTSPEEKWQKLQGLWDDVAADFGDYKAGNIFGAGVYGSPESRAQYGYDTSGMTTLAPGGTTQGWPQQTLGPGVNTQVQQVGDTQATPAEVANFYDQQQNYMNNLAGDTTSQDWSWANNMPITPISAQFDQSGNLIDQSQDWSWANNMPITPISARFDQSGNLIDEGSAVVQTQGANFLDVQPTSGASYSDRNIFSPEIEDEDIETGFWGGGSPHG